MADAATGAETGMARRDHPELPGQTIEEGPVLGEVIEAVQE